MKEGLRIQNFIQQLDLRTTVFVGLGNPDRGDDNFGLEFAKRLHLLGVPHIFSELDSIDSLILDLKDDSIIQTVIFLDTIDQAVDGGTIILLQSNQFPPPKQSHAIPLGVYATILESAGKKVFCLGAQPVQLEFQTPLSPLMESALNFLLSLFLKPLKAFKMNQKSNEP